MANVGIFKIDEWGYPRFTGHGFMDKSEAVAIAESMRADGFTIELLTYGEFKSRQDPDTMPESEVRRRFCPDVPTLAPVKRGVVITGTLPGITRSQAEMLLREKGWQPQADVSGATAFVVAGEKPGSKVERARASGIPIKAWSEIA